MEVNSQLHGLTLLSLGKEHPVPTEEEAGSPQRLSVGCVEEKNLFPSRNRI
jgi:hypothetical protein